MNHEFIPNEVIFILVLTFKIVRNATIGACIAIAADNRSPFAAFSSCNSSVGAFRGWRVQVAFATDDMTTFDAIALYGFFDT